MNARKPDYEEIWHQGGEGRPVEACWHLLAMMSEASEDAWCATWVSGLEFTLWRDGIRPAQPGDDDSPTVTGYSSGHIPHGFARRAVAMAELLDCWWVYVKIKGTDEQGKEIWPGDDRWGPVPVPLARWRKAFAISEYMAGHDLAAIARAYAWRKRDESKPFLDELRRLETEFWAPLRASLASEVSP